MFTEGYYKPKCSTRGRGQSDLYSVDQTSNCEKVFDAFFINFHRLQVSKYHEHLGFLHLIAILLVWVLKGNGCVCQLSEFVDICQGRKVIAGPSSEANRKMMILLAVCLLK